MKEPFLGILGYDASEGRSKRNGTLLTELPLNRKPLLNKRSLRWTHH